MKRLLGLAILSLLLILGACSDEETNVPETETPDNETETPEPEETPTDEQANEEEDEEEAEEVDLTAYFMEDGTTAHFKGEGNEFAELNIRTEYLQPNYVALYEDNGGTRILRVYRLADNRIELVENQPEHYTDYSATAEELDALEPISTYLETPISVGNQINGMEVIEMDATVQTPFKTFDDAIVLEQRDGGGGINRSYLVEGYGEVKREFIMEEEENTFTVTSSLETIE